MPGALADLQTRAGAVFARRQGRPVAVSYGSAAGELAACLRAVGMADSSSLTKLELCGPARPLAELIRLATGRTLAPGGVLETGGTWWCGADAPSRTFAAQRVIVLGEPELGERLRALLQARAARRPGLAVADRSRDFVAITVIGAATNHVLASLGVFGPTGDPHHVPPFTRSTLGEVEMMWLLQSSHRALALVRSAGAGAAWHAIERAGRPQHICCVGQDAIARYALLERRGAPARG